MSVGYPQIESSKFPSFFKQDMVDTFSYKVDAVNINHQTVSHPQKNTYRNLYNKLKEKGAKLVNRLKQTVDDEGPFFGGA